MTADLDICYSRDTDNLDRLVEALQPLAPGLRVPSETKGLPFLWDAVTLRNGMNFTLMTTAGDLDLLGEVSGLGSYEEVRRRSNTVSEKAGNPCTPAVNAVAYRSPLKGSPSRPSMSDQP